MGEVIDLFDPTSETEVPWAECTQCGGINWRILLTPVDNELGISGFQCANENCAIVGMFDKENDINVFEINNDKSEGDD